jgi:hypothetical protein
MRVDGEPSFALRTRSFTADWRGSVHVSPRLVSANKRPELFFLSIIGTGALWEILPAPSNTVRAPKCRSLSSACSHSRAARVMSSLVLSFRDCAIVYALSKHRDLYLLRGFPSTLSRFRIVESAAVGTRPQCKPHAIRDERAARRVRHVYSTGFPCGYAQAPCCFVFCRWRRIPQFPDLPNPIPPTYPLA